MDKKLPTQTEDFSGWYNQVVLDADLADYGPARGSMVIKPYGYAIWEQIQKLLDARIKAAGVQNAYFPLLIPESLLQREVDHVEGFAPEVAWVTEGGNEKLEERLAIRPTSETIMYDVFSRWIHSYRDLPLKINQWANVLRWEKRTKLFFRTSEFLWQEGHTVHATFEEASAEARRALDMYIDLIRNDLALAVTPGTKPDHERFAGAQYTLSVEGLMRDSKGLQLGTSHHLGSHFAEVYGIRYAGEDGVEHVPYQTSWGVSTRLIGGIISSHGDDQGLILPPAIAPYQVVIVPISKNETDAVVVQQAAALVVEAMPKDIRVHIDMRDQYSAGYKFNDWELKGVPLRIDIGPRDIAAGQVTVVDRLSKEKKSVQLSEIATVVPEQLRDFSKRLLERHEMFTREHTVKNLTGGAFFDFLNAGKGQVLAGWDGTLESAELAKERAKVTIRTLPFDAQGSLEGVVCAVTGKPAKALALWAKAY